MGKSPQQNSLHPQLSVSTEVFPIRNISLEHPISQHSYNTEAQPALSPEAAAMAAAAAALHLVTTKYATTAYGTLLTTTTAAATRAAKRAAPIENDDTPIGTTPTAPSTKRQGEANSRCPNSADQQRNTKCKRKQKLRQSPNWAN